MSFINDIAFVERVDELEVEGNLTVGGDILLQGEFPKENVVRSEPEIRSCR